MQLFESGIKMKIRLDQGEMKVELEALFSSHAESLWISPILGYPEEVSEGETKWIRQKSWKLNFTPLNFCPWVSEDGFPLL